jgi:hypothetical protein
MSIYRTNFKPQTEYVYIYKEKPVAARESAGTGITLGSLLAVILSWTSNHSIAWCILHFFCSWFYVIYWALNHLDK